AAGEGLFETIERFQKEVVRVRKPDGVVDPGKKTHRHLLKLSLNQRAALDRDWIIEWAPAWVKVAATQLGVHELRGVRRNSQRVMQYIATVPKLKTCEIEFRGKTYMYGDVDESAWCGCFVNWCLLRSGYPGHIGLNAARAKEWKSYGVNLNKKPEYGCIICIDAKIKGRRYNHVGFYMGERNGRKVILGGNQENSGRPGGRVCVSEFSDWETTACVKPFAKEGDE
ncbi:MAG: TIGR02594 family protein, partial [Planctomycetota bacterium]